jgi:CRP-like cAMP-binding protein
MSQETTAHSPRKYTDANAAVQRLSAFADLAAPELVLLSNMSRQTRSYLPREEIWNENKASAPRVVISGWACRQRTLGDGRRQIVSFVLPGDPCHSLERPTIPGSCTVVALTTVVVADAKILEIAVNEWPLRYPGLAMAIRLLGIQETMLLQDQVVRLGRQTAYERTLHLLLELRERLDIVGLVTQNVFPLPLTQEILADALGLSIVHVNRTLQQIRRDGILEFRGGSVTILDLEAMYAVSDFVPISEHFA